MPVHVNNAERCSTKNVMGSRRYAFVASKSERLIVDELHFGPFKLQAELAYGWLRTRRMARPLSLTDRNRMC